MIAHSNPVACPASPHVVLERVLPAPDAKSDALIRWRSGALKSVGMTECRRITTWALQSPAIACCTRPTVPPLAQDKSRIKLQASITSSHDPSAETQGRRRTGLYAFWPVSAMRPAKQNPSVADALAPEPKKKKKKHLIREEKRGG